MSTVESSCKKGPQTSPDSVWCRCHIYHTPSWLLTMSSKATYVRSLLVGITGVEVGTWCKWTTLSCPHLWGKLFRLSFPCKQPLQDLMVCNSSYFAHVIWPGTAGEARHCSCTTSWVAQEGARGPMGSLSRLARWYLLPAGSSMGLPSMDCLGCLLLRWLAVKNELPKRTRP